MNGWRHVLQDSRSRGGQVRGSAERDTVDALLDAVHAESGRADSKSATLLVIVGIGFTAFAAAGTAVTAATLHGPARWLCLGALAGVSIVAELLLLALRPTLGSGSIGQQYFSTWRRYADAPVTLATELSAELADCQTLIDVSQIVWRKYLLIRWSVDLLLVIVPVIGATLLVALMLH